MLEADFEEEDDEDDEVDPESTEEQGDAHQLKLDMDEQIAQGIYSNFVMNVFRPEEFVLDFAFLQPNMPRGKIRTRILMNARTAKRLSQLLEDQIARYETQYGVIGDDAGPDLGAAIRMSFN
jgi:hypothetical protein